MAELTGAPIAGRAMRAGGFVLPEPLILATIGAVAVGIALRAILDAGLPFWLDETFFGAIAAEETWGGVLRQSLLDANAPLYPFLLHLWSQLFGLSDTALRAPSVLFGIAAIFVALIPTPGISRPVRLIWRALVAVWIPALAFAQEARCYSILFCLSIGCTVAYARLLAAPDTRRAVIWSVLASLSILTHYDALVLAGLQGLGYLAMHRAKAIRTWPAALAFIPVFAWIAVHAPRIVQFTDPAYSWYSRLTLPDSLDLVHFIFGNIMLAAAVVLIVAVPMIVPARFRSEAGFSRDPKNAGFTSMVVSTAVLGAAIVVALGVMRPSFVPRYLVPFMPGILLGFAMGMAWLGRRWALSPIAILCAALTTAIVSPFGVNRSLYKFYSFEEASQALMTSDTTHVVFLWDNPVTRIYDPSQLDAAGGFFFRRAGWAVTVAPLQLNPDDDPNPHLLAAAAAPGSAILWLYDVNVRATAALLYPPRIDQLDPAWQCKNFARGPFGVIACYRGALRS